MRTNSKRVSLFVLVALFVASFIGFAFSAFSTRNYASGEENALVYNGVSGYKLVVPGAESANTPIYCAAYFMRERIKEATGITLPDVYFNGGSHTAARTYSGTYTDTERVISFGSTDYLESSGISFDDSALKDDGFYLKTQGKSLFIYGKTERGIANGMLEVLERLGFEFYGDEIYVPELTNVYLPDLNICDNPDFDMRSYGDWYCQHSWLTDYTLRMTNAFLGMSEATPAEKNNMIQYGVLPSAFFNGEDTDGNNIIASLSPTHNTATDLVPYNTYFADHPEWYYVNDGHVLELCWSNVGLNADGSINTGLSTSPVKVAIERIKEYILNTDASVKYFFIGQEDKATGYCTCSSCTANAAAYGKSGMVIRFVNAISDAIAEWLPTVDSVKDREINFITLAYQWSVDAPVKKVNGTWVAKDASVIPNDNVYIQICTITANQYYALTDSTHNSALCDVLEKWQAVAENQIMIWSYHQRAGYAFVYFPTMQHWAQDFSAYQDAGVKYVFMQSTSASKENWQGHMESWIASKMLWDSSLNYTTLRADYISKYYAGISDLVSSFIANYDNLFAAHAQAGTLPNMTLQGNGSMVESSVYSKTFWETQLGLIDDMFETANELPLTAKQKTVLTNKIKVLALSVYSTILYNYDDYDFGSSVCSEKEMQYLFFTYCADLDNIGAGENQTIDQLKGEWGYTDFDMISGASVRLKTESGIRFGAAMSNDYYSSFFDKEGNPTDETREFGTVIAPTTYFNGISAGSDYIAELLAKKAAGTVAKEPLIILCTPFQKSGSAEDSPWYINGSIANILYNNYNRSFTGICFIRTGTAGNYSYTYANFGSFDAISRSVIDVAVKASNDTDADLTESEMAILGGLVKYGVNKANGVSEADKENAPSITVSIDNSDVLYGVGETATLSATVSPSLGLQVVFSSSDDTVATVLNGNNLLCLKSGTATITASCGGYTDTFDITVCDYTVNAPNYLAIGGTATLSITSASELGTASYTSSNSAIVSVSGSVITANAAGSTTITVRVSETAQVKTVKITVIDADALFGSSGVSKDFTEDETLWSYGNANSDPDVQINYDGENVKADGNNRKRYALEYYRSLNTGSALDAATRNGSLLYLDSDIVKIAIAKGYKYLTYKYLCDANGYASFTTVDGIAVGAWLNSGVATNWRFCTIDLTNPSLASIRDNDDFGVGFYTYSQYLYLSEVRFVGGDISGDIEDYLEDNLAQSTVYNKAFVKAMNASSDIGFDTDTITVSRNSNSIAYDKGNTVLGNHVYLDADWIKAAKALGYTRIQMRLSASASAAAGLYRVPYTSITSTSNSLWSGTLTTAKTFVNVSLESFNDGDSLAFAFNSASGQILKISEIQFMSGDLVVPTSVSVSASDYYVQKGETLQLEPTVLPDASYDKSVSYTSSATGVATVSTSGLVSAKTVGTSTITITATVSGVSTTCTIHVVDISLKKFIAKGQSVDLSGDYDYTVSDGGSYASVSGDTLTGTGNGVATITVSKSGQDITDIDVRVIDFTTVDFAEDATIWGYHDTYGDTVSITTVKDISDSRANPITYDALRYYRAENTGTARARTNNMLYLHPDIIAAAQEMGYSRLYYKIYIPKMNNTASTTNYIVMNCKEDGDVAVIPNGSTNVIQASVDNNAQWTTKTISLTEVATTQQGLHADTGIGFAVNGQNTYLSHVFFAGISLETTSSTIKVGDTVQLEPTIMHSYDTSVSYTSNDTSVATVSASGLITAVSAGSATITLTADQSFATATYTVSVMGDVPKYIAKGQSVEIGDGLEYEITEGSSYISISDGILTGIANGTATFTVNGDEYTVRVIDFGKDSGTNFDLASDTTLWDYHDTLGDTVSITNVEAVADSRSLEYDALRYYRDENTGEARDRTNNMLYLHPDIIAAAKAVGYQYMTFYIYIPSMGADSTTNYLVMNCKNDGDVASDGGLTNSVQSSVDNKATWTYKTISLTTVNNNTVGLHTNRGIGFAVNGQNTYLAKVEFIGADISAYTSTVLIDGATTGKTVDLVQSGLIDKMYQTTCNTSSLTHYASGGYNSGAYIKFTGNSYSSSSASMVNALVISADWIKAAKASGYSVIGIRFAETNGSAIQLRKLKADGTFTVCKNASTGKDFSSSYTSYGFLSIDLSTFSDGDSLVICIGSGKQVSISDITFRTSAVTPSPTITIPS